MTMQATPSSLRNPARSAPARSTRLADRNPQEFLARRAVAADGRPRPAAVCTHCRNFSFTASAFDAPCERLHHGQPCRGVVTAIGAPDAWRPCTACDGTGWRLGMVCMHCDSLGWRLARHG